MVNTLAYVLVFMAMVDIWTYLVTVSLFSLCFMNFMFYTTLDAVGNILRMHYKSMKCDVSFSQGSASTLFGWGEYVLRVCVKMFFLLTAVQKFIKNQTSFFQSYDHKCTATFFFMKHSVYVYFLSIYFVFLIIFPIISIFLQIHIRRYKPFELCLNRNTNTYKIS